MGEDASGISKRAQAHIMASLRNLTSGLFGGIDFLAEFDRPEPATMPDRFLGFIEEARQRYQRPVQLMTPNMLRNPHLKNPLSATLPLSMKETSLKLQRR
ncbi:MAG: hypothetical protein ACOCVG_03425 [Verrucomicrobiota bacterium]